jgi:predicted porin
VKNCVRQVASIALGLGACAAGSAQAQSSVTLYGVIDTFIESTNAGNGLTTRMGSSGFYASRFGMKGSEDIGGGNRINFTLESGINTNNGTAADPTAIFNRQAWVGLSGNWGEFRMGRQNTPQFLLISRFDAFGGATMASGLDNFASYTFRVSNAFSYQTPVIAGLKAQVLYGLSQSAVPQNGHDNIHAGVEYANGPVFLAANYEKMTNAAATDVQRDMFAGGSYDFGSLKLFAAYHHAQDSAKVYDKDVYSVSAQYRFTPADFVSAGYAYANDRLPAGNNAAEISLMAQHLLSKRTLIYATLSHISNHNQAAYTMLGAATQGVQLSHPGFDPTGAQVGILHFF